MDLKQIEYIVKIAETGNITRAAEQLFVTQSALNQQLLKLENALGIKLFYRRKHDLTPTDAGKVYLKYGRQMLIEKREAYNIINDLAQDNLGHLSFTFSRERGLDMFVATYPAFHRQFPGIIVEPHEMRVHNQQLQITQGYVDLGLVTLSEQQKLADLQYDHVRYESLLLCLPRKHPLAKDAAPVGTYLEDLPYMDLSAIKELPFVLIYKESTMRSLINRILGAAKIRPYVLFESGSIRALLKIVASGLACTITSAGYIRGKDDVAFYRIPGDPLWEMCTVHKKDDKSKVKKNAPCEMYPPYWVSSKEGTFQWSGHFMLSLFLGSSDQRLKESKTDVNISIAFWVLMVQDNLLDIIFRMELKPNCKFAMRIFNALDKAQSLIGIFCRLDETRSCNGKDILMMPRRNLVKRIVPYNAA